MNAIGIICEYNPFHLGHARMLEGLRRQYDAPLVCAMSGNFVQRGDAAVAHKHARAEMAVRCGADLVLELPTPWAMASAERFAAGGVALLTSTGVVSHLAFGSECGNLTALQAAEAALSCPASGSCWPKAWPMPRPGSRRRRSWALPPGCSPVLMTFWPSST